MDLATAQEMREIDRRTIEERGVPSNALMENAGLRVFEALQRYHPDLGSKTIAVVCGKGNNGGDGRVVARLLRGVAKEVVAIEVGSDFTDPLRSSDIVIDAVFGIGLSRNVEGEEKKILEAINASKKWVLAVDIPSGLSADTGKPLGIAVKADVTITMGLPKVGLVLPEAAPFVGRLEVAEIGIPPDVVQDFHLKRHWITAVDVRPFFRPRNPSTHKGIYGHALLIGGSEKKPGAILLSGRAALRTGAGLVTVALPDRAFKKFPKKFLELMYEPMPSTKRGTVSRKALNQLLRVFEGKDAIAVGPGLGVDADTKLIVQGLLRKTDMPMILDADALNCLQPPLKRKSPTILTPHPGEMARLLDTTTAVVQKNRLETARDFAVKQGVFLVLKGFRTVVASPSGELFVNSTGNAGMATAGMGDVLTGIIASLLAQGMEVLPAVISGVYLHGRAGDRVAERLGDRGLLATDVIEEMPHAIHEILR